METRTKDGQQTDDQKAAANRERIAQRLASQPAPAPDRAPDFWQGLFEPAPDDPGARPYLTRIQERAQTLAIRWQDDIDDIAQDLTEYTLTHLATDPAYLASNPPYWRPLNAATWHAGDLRKTDRRRSARNAYSLDAPLIDSASSAETGQTAQDSLDQDAGATLAESWIAGADLRTALLALPEPQRLAILGADLLRLSRSELAAQLGQTPRQAKETLTSARQALRVSPHLAHYAGELASQAPTAPASQAPAAPASQAPAIDKESAALATIGAHAGERILTATLHLQERLNATQPQALDILASIADHWQRSELAPNVAQALAALDSGTKRKPRPLARSDRNGRPPRALALISASAPPDLAQLIDDASAALELDYGTATELAQALISLASAHRAPAAPAEPTNHRTPGPVWYHLHNAIRQTPATRTLIPALAPVARWSTMPRPLHNEPDDGHAHGPINAPWRWLPGQTSPLGLALIGPAPQPAPKAYGPRTDSAGRPLVIETDPRPALELERLARLLDPGPSPLSFTTEYLALDWRQDLAILATPAESEPDARRLTWPAWRWIATTGLATLADVAYLAHDLIAELAADERAQALALAQDLRERAPTERERAQALASAGAVLWTPARRQALATD